MNTEEYSKWINGLTDNDLYSELRNIEVLIKVSKNKEVLELVKVKKELVEKELKKRKK